MGIFNNNPYGNDIAADWFGDLMKRTGLRGDWLEAIVEDPAKEPEIVRAAVWLFVQLGHVYVWPIETHNADLKRAIVALGELPDSIAVDRVEVLKDLVSRLKTEDRGTPTGQTHEQDIVPIFRIHATTGTMVCESPWFLSRSQAERYPHKSWDNCETEERRGIIIDDVLFVNSDCGYHNPEHDPDPDPDDEQTLDAEESGELPRDDA